MRDGDAHGQCTRNVRENVNELVVRSSGNVDMNALGWPNRLNDEDEDDWAGLMGVGTICLGRASGRSDCAFEIPIRLNARRALCTDY